MSPLIDSQQAVAGYAHSICNVGHQGLIFGKETGLYYVRTRYLNAVLGRYNQRDSMGYADGMSLYEYAASNPARNADPSGTISVDPGTYNPAPYPTPSRVIVNIGIKGKVLRYQNPDLGIDWRFVDVPRERDWRVDVYALARTDPNRRFRFTTLGGNADWRERYGTFSQSPQFNWGGGSNMEKFKAFGSDASDVRGMKDPWKMRWPYCVECRIWKGNLRIHPIWYRSDPEPWNKMMDLIWGAGPQGTGVITTLLKEAVEVHKRKYRMVVVMVVCADGCRYAGIQGIPEAYRHELRSFIGSGTRTYGMETWSNVPGPVDSWATPHRKRFYAYYGAGDGPSIGGVYKHEAHYEVWDKVSDLLPR